MHLIASLLHETRWRPRWAALLALLLLVVSWFAFRPAPPELDEIAGLDKLKHLAAFGTLALVAMLAQPAGRRALALSAGGLLFYGLFIEFVQAFLPTRSAEAADLLADAAGIALGLVLTLALRRVFGRLTP
jgi:VanZ family protein